MINIIREERTNTVSRRTSWIPNSSIALTQKFVPGLTSFVKTVDSTMATQKNAEEIFTQMLQEILSDIAFEAEIELHFESSFEAEMKKYVKEKDLAVNPLDIFNNANSKDVTECICPNCGRTLGAIRFAPHLEKCVGMGRSSSRIASRRILASSNSGKDGKYSDEISDGNGGGSQSSNPDWSVSKGTKRVDVRRKKDRTARHHKNRKKAEESLSNGVEEGEEQLRYDAMNYEQRQNILAHMCGVVSEHTGKLCTRSVRCPKHSDQQRNDVRFNYLRIDNPID